MLQKDWATYDANRQSTGGQHNFEAAPPGKVAVRSIAAIKPLGKPGKRALATLVNPSALNAVHKPPKTIHTTSKNPKKIVNAHAHQNFTGNGKPLVAPWQKPVVAAPKKVVHGKKVHRTGSVVRHTRKKKVV